MFVDVIDVFPLREHRRLAKETLKFRNWFRPETLRPPMVWEVTIHLRISRRARLFVAFTCRTLMLAYGPSRTSSIVRFLGRY